MQSHRDWLLAQHGSVCAYCGTDTPLVAFLMQRRARGVFLLHYGEHLSDPLRELAKQASERPIVDKE